MTSGDLPRPAVPAVPAVGAGGEQGQATVELVLVLPVVVLALLLVIQVGVVVRAQALVVDAARSGARAAAVDGSSTAARVGVEATPGLRSDQLAVAASVGGPGGLARVEVSYRVRTDVPLVGALLGDPVVHATTTMRVEGAAG